MPGVLGRRGPYAKTEKRRSEIAAAVLALVIENGHRSVTAAEVAERTGLSEPGVLYHFPTKEALLLAGLRRFDEEEFSKLPAGQSLAIAGEQAEEGVHRENIVRLYSAMSGEASDPTHPAHDFFKERWKAANAIMSEDLKRLQDLGEVSPDLNPDRVSRQIHAAWEGLQLQWLVDPTFNIAEELTDLIEALTGVRQLAKHLSVPAFTP